MIPKIIHYCWLSGEQLPDSVLKCIESWERHLSDYQTILWDYNRFPRGKSKWVDQAFDKHKYAFAADCIRLYALYNYGGIYLDSDVEVVKSYNELLYLPYFIGAEQTPYGIEAATMAFPRGSAFIKGILDSYIDKSFVNDDNSLNTEPLPRIVRRYIAANYDYHLIYSKEEFIDRPNVINVFSEDFFSPKHYKTRKISTTDNTFSIHHFAGAWVEPSSPCTTTAVKRDKTTLKKYIRYHLLPKSVNIISSEQISIIFKNKFNLSVNNPLLRAEVAAEDIKYITEHEITLNPSVVTFIKKDDSKVKSTIRDFYPIARIAKTNVECHFVNDFSREIVMDYWKNEFNLSKKRRNVFIIPSGREIKKWRLYFTAFKILLGWNKIIL